LISFFNESERRLAQFKINPPNQGKQFCKKKPGILGKDSGRLDETMRIGEDGIVISQS
jgi:hypothetical protein